VTPLTLGIETLGGVMTPLIERNTTIPVRQSQVFSTAEDGQTAVTVHILQGERSLAADNVSLGQFNLEGIPPAPRGMPQIEVTFDIDANGILNVSANDKATGSVQAITITASTNLDQDDVDRMVRDAKQNEVEDRRRKELVEARNNADAMIYQIDKSLRDLGDKVPATDRATIERTIDDLKRAKESDDTAHIQQLTEQLQQASYAIGQQVYAQQTAGSQQAGGAQSGGYAGGPAGGPWTGGAPGNNGNTDDVIDGDFSEV
jgi:molecular chaperone DnaK